MKQYCHYLFDLYGTLIDNRNDERSLSLWKPLSDIYAVYGADYSPDDLQDAFWRMDHEEREKVSKSLHTKYPEIRLEIVFLRLLKEAPKSHQTDYSVTDEDVWVNMIANVFRVLSRSRMKLFPDTMETLSALRKRGSHVYLLSNAQKIFTRPEIEITGLLPCFDDMFLSSDYGLMKPEIRYIEAMMKKHGMKSDETVMIGDTFESDMAIAKAAGIDGIYLNSAGHDEKWIHEHNRTGAVVIEKIGELLKEPR